MKNLTRTGGSFFVSTKEENFRILFQALVEVNHGNIVNEEAIISQLEIIEEDVNQLAKVKDFLTEDFIRGKGLSGDYSLLHLAAIAGLSDVVEFILRNGAEVDLKNSAKQNALYCAAKAGHPDVVEVLLNRGASTFFQEDEFKYLQPEVLNQIKVSTSCCPKKSAAVSATNSTSSVRTAGGN